MTAIAFVPKVMRIVTVPTLTPKAGTTYFLKFLSAAAESKVRQKDKDGKDQQPAHIAQVVMLETGEARTLIVNAVLLSILGEEYPSNSYVGKGFQIEAHNAKDGKRYKGFSVAELDLSADEPAAPEAPVVPAAPQSAAMGGVRKR